jgi:hypothetical protein
MAVQCSQAQSHDPGRQSSPAGVDGGHGAAVRTCGPDRYAVRRHDADTLTALRRHDRIRFARLAHAGRVDPRHGDAVHLHRTRDVVSRGRAAHAKSVLDAECI